MEPSFESQAAANSNTAELGTAAELAWQIYAKSYDNILPILPFYMEVVDRHLDTILATSSRTAIDVGAGTGNVTIRLAEAGVAVSAIDTSQEMLSKLSAKCATAHASSVSILLHNAEELALATSSRTAIDVGAGTGNVTIRLAEAGVAVSAIDTSQAMLSKLSAKCATAHASSVSILLHNAEELALAFPTASFDAGTILLALYGMERPRQALIQTMNLVRPAGTLVITEPKESFSLNQLIVFVEEFLRSTGQYEKLIDDWHRVLEANRVLNPEVRANRLFVEDIVPQLEQGGFSVQSVTDSHLGNCATIVARKTDGG